MIIIPKNIFKSKIIEIPNPTDEENILQMLDKVKQVNLLLKEIGIFIDEWQEVERKLTLIEDDTSIEFKETRSMMKALHKQLDKIKL